MKNESDFMWSDGSNMTYKSMSPQMDYVKDERADQEMDCVATDQNGQWTTFHCDDKFYFLCKKKLSKWLIFRLVSDLKIRVLRTQICTGRLYQSVDQIGITVVGLLTFSSLMVYRINQIYEI